MIELMVSLVIMSVGILGLNAMTFHSARAVQDAAEISMATNLGQAIIDELQLLPFEELPLGDVADFPLYYDKRGAQLPTAVGSYFEIDAAIQRDGPTMNGIPWFKDVAVTVSWTDRGVGGRTTWGDDHSMSFTGRIRRLPVGDTP